MSQQRMAAPDDRFGLEVTDEDVGFDPDEYGLRFREDDENMFTEEVEPARFRSVRGAVAGSIQSAITRVASEKAKNGDPMSEIIAFLSSEDFATWMAHGITTSVLRTYSLGVYSLSEVETSDDLAAFLAERGITVNRPSPVRVNIPKQETGESEIIDLINEFYKSIDSPMQVALDADAGSEKEGQPE
jgi:hypothetical protein